MRHLTPNWNTALVTLAVVALVLAAACGGAGAPSSVESGQLAVSEKSSSSPASEDKPAKSMSEDRPAATVMEKQAPAMAEKPAIPARETTHKQDTTPKKVKQDTTTAEKPSARSGQSTTVMEKQPAAAAVKPEVPSQELPPIGSQVGNTVPEFTLNLLDGGSITSAELMNQDQPSFLFFHATF